MPRSIAVVGPDFREGGRVTLKNLYIFVAIFGALISYLLYIMIRARKGERPGSEDRESEL
jgi:hypothetical protein